MDAQDGSPYRTPASPRERCEECGRTPRGGFCSVVVLDWWSAPAREQLRVCSPSIIYLCRLCVEALDAYQKGLRIETVWETVVRLSR